MANKQISELTEATTISNTDLFVIQQGTTAKKCTGETFLAMVEAHGGIASASMGSDYKLTFTFADGTTWTSSISLRGETGNGISSITKTSTSGLVDTYTITFTDSTTTTFTITNGAKGDTGDDAEVLLTEYQADTQGTTPPTGTWQSTVPTVGAGNYLWTRFTWNNAEYSYVVCKYGNNGQGSGDMEKADYDSDDSVITAGGIADYVTANASKKPSYTTSTMTSANWSNSTYSFESTYPYASYDITISVAPTATSAQFDAFSKAKICGSASSNIVTAIGTVPSVDIPIIIKVVAK